MGFILLLWSLAQTVRAALPLACLGSPPAWALPSPPHIASTLPLNHTPFLPRALTPQLARAQPTLQGQNSSSPQSGHSQTYALSRTLQDDGRPYHLTPVQDLCLECLLPHLIHLLRLSPILQGQFRCHLLWEACSDHAVGPSSFPST